MIDVKQDTPSFPDPFHLPSADDIKIVTLVELRIRTLAGEILEKPSWWTKVKNDEIVGKWRTEFIEKDAELVKHFWPNADKADDDEGDDDNYHETEDYRDVQTRKLWPRKKITDEQLNYIFEWLKWLADNRDPETGIEATHIANVYHSYYLIPQDLKEALLKGASILESVPEDKKDWHPGSNNQVLDLIHPSLYCFRIGKTLVKNTETGKLYVPSLEEYLDDRDARQGQQPYSWSYQHQWLPTDFSVSESGEVTSLSYINNLHPDDHKPMYSTITSILERFVPLWDRVLSDVLSPQELILTADPYAWYDQGRATPEPQLEDFGKKHPDDENAARREYYAVYDKWDDRKDPCIPEPGPFTPPNPDEREHFTLKGRNIQVIVKMANIMLTPESPKYRGGSWHVEGMENEHIVATGIYYYDSSNVTESKLSFRTALDQEMPYQQSDIQGMLRVYGINGSEGPLNQELGGVATKAGKCLAFPNIWQHCVSPFELADPSTPGHRKILCFFLVDPTVTILSTAVVPPQQYEWYMRESERAPALQNLPQELFDMVADEIKAGDGQGGAITLEQAKEVREELMEERANFVMEHNENVYEMEFNMCEH